MRILSSALFAVLLCTGAAYADDKPAVPAAVYDPIRWQAGVWDADIRFFDPASGAQTGSAKGVQTNVLLSNGHWVTNDLQVFGNAEAQPSNITFQGHGVWGWDPVARQYVDTWVDTNDGAVRTDFGFWQAEARTMHWTALQPDGAGHMVNYRMTEAYSGDNQRTLTFHQVALQSGRLVKIAEMRFTRR